MRDKRQPTAESGTSPRAPHDVGTGLGVPILAVIPVMLTTEQLRRRRQGWVALAMSVPCVAALAWLALR